MKLSQWSGSLVMAAVAAAGLVLSFVAYEASGGWAWLVIGLLLTGALLLAFGISFRATARAERRAAERFRAVIDNAHDAIIAINAQGRIETFNPAAERIFGYNPDEVIGRNVHVLMPEPYHGEHDGYLHNYVTTGKAKIIGTGREVEARHKDGRVFPIDLSVGEMSGASGRGFIGIIRDITERHEAKSRERELTAELVHISRLSAMGELASSLAHELNQPLTAIMNYAEAARQIAETAGPAVPAKVPEFLGKAVAQAERAGQIIRRLRSFVEKGPVERSPEDLNRVVIDASNLAAIGARVDGIRVQFDLDDGLPPVSIDKIQIQQVVVNLVRNAVEVLRDADRRELVISTRAEGGGLEVAICDTGPGIAPEIAERLFTPFVTSKQDGMGIGLSISSSIVEAHDGRLWAEPNPDGGTVFRFRLPGQPAGEKTADEQTGEGAGP
ncbi:two-component system sensor histidine kinase NtrB [Ferrovibrio xuzhouensis]|uniref:histidine kinase n=1 Tax=Ferrovibrio xuzhouensis TaxID=1576914 RepID=A0ABV7VD34_9PROT